MSGRAADLVVVSPHLDDAVLSCGARIAAVTAGGGRAVVATLFTADEPAAPPSALAADLRRWWRLPGGEVMAARRREDAAALARLGAELVHLDLPEAPYRTGADGRPFYTALGTLFGEPEPADATALAPRLDASLARLPTGGLRLAPLGVGGHVDHRLTRAATERAGGDLAYYEEFPYVEWKWLALRRALGRPADWIAETVAVPPELFEAKIAAILAYASQVPAMFRSEGRLRKQLRRHLRRAGGERVWRPRGRRAAEPT
jgi:LmbE family N-acetylglucosaminyl deacetylase